MEAAGIEPANGSDRRSESRRRRLRREITTRTRPAVVLRLEGHPNLETDWAWWRGSNGVPTVTLKGLGRTRTPASPGAG
jgi:hypothetical protein